jgi:hypothetical protein
MLARAVALLAASKALAVEATETLATDTLAADTPVPLAAAAVVLLALALSFLPAGRVAASTAVLIVAFVGCAAAAAGALVTLTDPVTDLFAGAAAVRFVNWIVLVVTFVPAAAVTAGTAAAVGLAAAAAAGLTAALLALLDAANPPVDRSAAFTAGVVINSPDAGS